MKRRYALLCIIISTVLTGCKNISDNFCSTETESSTVTSVQTTTSAESGMTYIVNISTGKFHCADCPSVEQMSEKNRRKYTGDRDDLISKGYVPCKRCEP